MTKLSKFLITLLVAMALLTLAGCRKNKVQNPIADLDSKQPDKVLFDRAMEALQKNKFDVARLTLQTLINTYPDSEYIARAKLAVGDAWYQEGTTAALAQAEVEYKDFITFFPNMPEAAEAQLKVAAIHYRQMEKPDRDYTHARRAQEEYKQLILQFPDSKLVPEAKQRLLEVQEVLAEREFRIGRFYFLRENWPAAIARLRSLTDSYPLYSGADEALMMLAGCFEAQMNNVDKTMLSESAKEQLKGELAAKAAESYNRILMRYPAMDRAEEARQRLEALGLPVPTPTAEALAQSKAEEDSRTELGRMGRIMLNFKKRPDVAAATKVGEPVMTDPVQTSAPAVLRQIADRVNEVTTGGSGSSGAVSVETVKPGEVPPNEAAPRSEAPSSPPQAETAAPATPPPAQVNEVTEQVSGQQPAPDPKKESSSKKKQKKGLRKLIPF